MATGILNQLCKYKELSNGEILSITSLPITKSIIFFANWTDFTNFPAGYGAGVIIPTVDSKVQLILYQRDGSRFWIGKREWNNENQQIVLTWNEMAKVT